MTLRAYVAACVLVVACQRADPAATASATVPSASSPASPPTSAPVASAASAAPVAVASDPPKLAQDYVTALEAVAAIFSQYAGKCSDLARALEGAAAQRDNLKGASSAAAHQAAAADTSLSRRVDEASRAIADGSMSCAKSAPFVAARKRLFNTEAR